jgi:hypothetical protein
VVRLLTRASRSSRCMSFMVTSGGSDQKIEVR